MFHFITGHFTILKIVKIKSRRKLKIKTIMFNQYAFTFFFVEYILQLKMRVNSSGKRLYNERITLRLKRGYKIIYKNIASRKMIRKV